MPVGLALAGLGLAASTALGQPDPAPAPRLQSFALSQVTQTASEPPALEAHLSLLDRDGAQIVELADRPGIRATLGDQPALATPLAPFESSGQGVAYVVLVDVSASLSPAVFARLQAALRAWIETFSAADRMALISFGDASRIRSDFTADFDAVQAVISGLAPTDRATLFHHALIDAVDLATRSDPDLPIRRAIVVLTDGRDEGSGLTLEDVLDRLEEARFPIYAIGFSNLTGDERTRSLDVLLRLATASGGAFVEADTADLDDAYRRIGRLIRGVWVTTLLCPTCRADGDRSHLEVALDSGQRVLSRGAAVRLLPGRGSADTSTWRDAATDRAPEESRPATPGEAEPGSDGVSSLAVALGALLALAAAAVALGLLLRARARSEQRSRSGLPPMSAPPVEPAPRPEPRGSASSAIGNAPASPSPRAVTPRAAERLSTPPMVASSRAGPRMLHVTVVRGATRGAEHDLLLRDTARVGRRSTCDLVLSQEPALDPEQFALVHSGQMIFLQDLSRDSSTLINGRTPEDPQPVEPGDLVGNRSVILRIR